MITMSEIIINTYSIMILSIIYIFGINHTEKNFLQYKLYMTMVRVNIYMLIIDVFSRFDGNPGTIFPIINHIGNFMIFLLNLLLPSLWLLYTHCIIVHDEKKTKGLLYPLIVMYTTYTLTLILSQFFGWFYYIDTHNIYHRGPYFLVPVFLMVVLILTAFILIIVNHKKVERKYFFSLVFFPIPPLACTFLQILFYGKSLALNGVVLSLLIVFLNFQSRGLNIDYLTGVYNRKKLETYMREKINVSTENKSFSAILMDLNNFKLINDTYGHNIGDNALENCVKIVKTCLRSSDFIARYGGDEFCIILDISTIEDLEATIARMNNCIKNYNDQGTQPYELSFSMGYAVYDYHSHMTVEEFQKYIDKLMYEDKRSIKRKINQ